MFAEYINVKRMKTGHNRWKRKIKMFHYKNFYYTWTGAGIPRKYCGFGCRPLQ